MPQSHTRIRCLALWWDAEKGDTAVFEPGDVRLGPGLSISLGIVEVKTTGHFYIAI